MTYFEIDDAATLEVEAGVLRRQRFDVNVKFIPGNYVTDSLIDLLEQNDFDFDLPTYFIWEGNTITAAGLHAADPDGAQELREAVSRVVRLHGGGCDFEDDRRSGITRLVESFASMGAPWLSGIRDIQSLAHDLGLNLIENFQTSELYRAYWVGRPMLSPIFNFYSVCTLGRESTH